MPHVVPSEIVRVIDRLFSFAAEATEPWPRLGIDVIGSMSAVVALVDRLPEDLLTLPPRDYADFWMFLEILRSKSQVAIVKGSGYTFSSEPVIVLRRLLSRCPDEATTAARHELKFIQPKVFRDDLRRDLAEANLALVDGRWKAATVLAGSVIEALLLWKLLKLTPSERQSAIDAVVWKPNQRAPAKGSKPDEWKFFQMIEVAYRAKLIAEKTYNQIDIARTFRNLIHPSRALRNELCNKGTAHSALAGVEHVIGDLSK